MWDGIKLSYGLFWLLVGFILMSHLFLSIEIPFEDFEIKVTEGDLVVKDSLLRQDKKVDPDSCADMVSNLEFNLPGLSASRMSFRLCSTDYIQAGIERSEIDMLPVAFSNRRRYDYHSLIKNDRSRLEKIGEQYIRFIKENRFTKKEAFDFIIKSIQQQPYVLVHTDECKDYLKTYEVLNWTNKFGYKFHKKEDYTIEKCLPGIEKYGVQSPYEFIANLKGDCDTRTSAAYSILDFLGFDVIILNSDVRYHSVLGVHGFSYPSESQSYQLNGKRYIICELTGEYEIGTWYFSHAFNPAEWFPVLT